MLSRIDRDGPMAASSAIAVHDGRMETADIVVEASSPGFSPVQVTIPTSTDPKDNVMAIAEASAGQPVDFFGHSKPDGH